MKYKEITCKDVGMTSDACDRVFKVVSAEELKSEVKKHYLLDGKHDASNISESRIKEFETGTSRESAKAIYDKAEEKSIG